MENRRPPPPDEGDPKIGDAESLFRDEPPPADPPKAPRKPAAASAGDDYAVEDLPDDRPARPVAPIFESPKAAKKAKTEGAAAPKPPRAEPTATVGEVWTRGAEWGGTIAKLAVTFVVVVVVLYLLLSSLMFGLAFLVLLVSVPFLVFVAYPILITLERPVRITPEQAINDYFSAASHHFPHYRRMWLLLSDEGRISGSFGSFEGFQSYWKERLNELRAGKAGGFTPLKFQVEDFRSEKSAGLSHITVNYVVNVFIRGQQDEGPVATMKVAMSLVKGPDRMWYLNRGTLP